MTQLVPRYDSMAFRRDSAVFEDCLSSVRDKYCVPLFLSDSEFIDNAHLIHCSYTVITNIEHHRRLLQDFALAKWFDIVQTEENTKKVPGVQFEYLRDGDIIRN